MELLNKESGSYFAASNTPDGFVSYFDQVFGGLERLYIIKGGSGVGKSRLMRDIAAAAEEWGLTVERFYCSLDPNSLDGIIIPAMSVGFVDGTAPHIVDPTHPGATEEVIDLSVFWDNAVLRKRKDEIVAICTQKKKIFDSAIGYLAVAGKAEEQMHRVIAPAVNHGSVYCLAKELTNGIKTGEGYTETIRNFKGIGAGGYVEFGDFGVDNELFVIKENYGIEFCVTEALRDIAKEKHCPVTISRSPLCPDKIDAIAFGGVTFALSSNMQGKEVCVKECMKQTLSQKELERAEELYKIKNSMINHAVDGFSRAMKLHFVLEDIYIGAMDFSQKEALTEKLTRQLFSD
ncbi:MAG: hypothetical protein FWB93_05255 [Oscillospiraceae bacterium]|nr:hypothetical protein [Oscillospiraceae bacterium]